MDIDDTIKVIVSVLSLIWGMYSYSAPYLNDFWKGFSLAAAFSVVAVMVVLYLEGRKQDAKRKRAFPCSKCERSISVKQPDDVYGELRPVPCAHGDSIKVEKRCRCCRTKNVRYWDREHPSMPDAVFSG